VAPAPATTADGVLLTIDAQREYTDELQPLTGVAPAIEQLAGLLHLAATGRKNLIVGGFMTHMCVSATVRSATNNGFMSTIAADTVATRDLPDATGGATVEAAAINRITLAALSDRFAWIVPKAATIG